MPASTYHLSDLEPLNAATRLLGEISRMPCIEISSAGEALTQLALAEDVPSPLRSYYLKVGTKLTEIEVRLKKYLRSAEACRLARNLNILTTKPSKML